MQGDEPVVQQSQPEEADDADATASSQRRRKGKTAAVLVAKNVRFTTPGRLRKDERHPSSNGGDEEDAPPPIEISAKTRSVASQLETALVQGEPTKKEEKERKQQLLAEMVKSNVDTVEGNRFVFRCRKRKKTTSTYSLRKLRAHSETFVQHAARETPRSAALTAEVLESFLQFLRKENKKARMQESGKPLLSIKRVG